MYTVERQRIPIKFTHKEKGVPESLFSLCLKYISKNLDVICTQDNVKGYKLHQGLVLPAEICEALLDSYQNNGGRNFDNFARLFEDDTKTNLRSICIHRSDISDRGLEYLLRHNLYNISLSMCNNLTQKTYMNIFKYAINLRSLTIGPLVGIIPLMEVLNNSDTLNNTPSVRYIEMAPNLKHLISQGIAESPYYTRAFVNGILDKLLFLRVLDLSYCPSVGNLECLSKLTNLHTLILFNVPYLQENDALVNICSLKSLVVLDISQTLPYVGRGIFQDENKTLALIVKCLPKLMSLDISGTNLAGIGTEEHTMCESSSGKKSDIPGLECRVNNPLHFLGLYHTMHNACLRHNIPAINISGNANEDQIFNAAASCMVKPRFIQIVLNDLKHLLKHNQCTKIGQALDVVLEALTRNIKEQPVQIYGCQTLIAIMDDKNLLLSLNDITVKRRIITTLLNGVDHHKNNRAMMRYAISVLCELRIPQDVMFEFRRLVHMLLHCVSTYKGYEELHQNAVNYLLNLVAQQLNYKQKNYMGKAGAIKEMMVITNDQLNRRICNEILGTAWLIMFHLTDGVPENCKRFLEPPGMQNFVQCLKTFPDENNLMYLMIKLLKNVAEVKELRTKLMKPIFIEVFSKLLYSSQHFIGVSYNAAGIIAHLASDGNEAWDIKYPSRSEVLERMTEAMKSWKLGWNDTNYCSFESILQLAQVKHTSQCQYWAAWTLANITTIYPEKYCPILTAEGGLKIMSELLDESTIDNQNSPDNGIHSLAQTVIDQCLVYMENTVEESPQENQSHLHNKIAQFMNWMSR